MQHIHLSDAALENISETGCDPAEDLQRLRDGEQTIAGLREHCLDGADTDRVQGWEDYIAAISEAHDGRELGGAAHVDGGFVVFATSDERRTWENQR